MRQSLIGALRENSRSAGSRDGLAAGARRRKGQAVSRGFAIILVLCSIPLLAASAAAEGNSLDSMSGGSPIDVVRPTSSGAKRVEDQQLVEHGRQPDHSRRDGETRFETISLAEGLSQSVVQSILQDSKGFMWFGTQDGLNRYDGFTFQVYRHVPGDLSSLSNSFIKDIHEGQDGALWVATYGGGLNRLDLSTGGFSHYRHDPDDPNSLSADDVTVLCEDQSGALWLGTSGGGLNRLELETGQFTRYQYDSEDPHSLASNTVYSILEDRRGMLWVGTDEGLDRFDPMTGEFIHYQGDFQDPHSLSSNVVEVVYEDRSGDLWVGTNGGGLARLDPASGQFEHYRHDPTDPRSLSDDTVFSILESSSGTLWVGTSAGGLNELGRESESFVTHRHDRSDAFSLSGDRVLSIHEDRSGMLWVGTFGAGVSVYDPYRQRFAHYESDPDDGQSMRSEQVWSIYEDGEGIVWLGTNRGLERFERATETFTQYGHEVGEPGSLSPGYVTAIHQDRNDVLWVGTWQGALGGGLATLDRETDRFRHYEVGAVFSMAEDREGTLWIGTLSRGLGKLDRRRGEFAFFEPDPDDPHSLSEASVTAISEDLDGILWVGTFSGGLNKFDRETEQFVQYRNVHDDVGSLSNDIVLSIYIDPDNVVWAATPGGLNRFDRALQRFTRYTESDGLANDTVYGILQDDAGNLWLSTNGGLSRFDPRDETFSNYDVTDGLQSNEFNQGAYFKNSRGEMFFGGINGFNVFHPEHVVDNLTVPPVVFTSLTQGGEDVDLGQTLDSVTDVSFRWPSNFFEFEFAALSYVQREQNQHAYRLEGFEEDWNHIGTRRFGRYTNLPGGTYTLRVKAANNDGIWNDEGAIIGITVVPPFWQTWWFRILSVGLVAGGAVGAFALRLSSVEGQRRQLEIQVEERTLELRGTLAELERAKDAAEAANRAKSRFLANMSHELRTPLNAILGFAQLMQRDANLRPNQQENLGIINQSGEHLLGLINEVLDLSKIEAGRMELNESPFDLHLLLDGLEDLFRLRAARKGLELVFEREREVPRYVWMDEGKLRQVLMNLLGNAVKFTETGRVTLRIEAVPVDGQMAEGFSLAFEVADTGPGIAPEELPTLFVPFEQTTSGWRSEEGTGLGLAISRECVRLMGGELTVTSPVSPPPSTGAAGSTFRFEVPAAMTDVTVLGFAQSQQRVVRLQPGQATRRVLIVEDNWANRKLLHQVLRAVGFEVAQATNGREALEMWEEWSPHAILIDMRMPVMDGYEATRRIRATTRGQSVVIIALTATAFDEDRAVILSQGCDAVIRKPFRERELLAVLADHLGVLFEYEGPPSVDSRLGRDRARERAGTVLPDDLFAELEEATVQADLGRIWAAVDVIRERDGVLGDALMDLARDFDHDSILELIQSLRGSEGDGGGEE